VGDRTLGLVDHSLPPRPTWRAAWPSVLERKEKQRVEACLFGKGRHEAQNFFALGGRTPTEPCFEI
jgi:hypothetical protein